MELIQRLIIGNNVYDINDEDLERDTRDYLGVLVQKQKTAKEGKEAIITATQNKTGKVITTNTYAEVIDKISKFEKKVFDVNDLIIRSIITEPMPTTGQYNREIIGNKISRFTQYNRLRDTKIVANQIKLTRDIIHIPTANNINYKLGIQVNLDFGAMGDKTPIISLAYNYSDLLFSFGKVGNSQTEMYFFNSYDDTTSKTVIDISNFNFFAIELEHKDTMSDTNIFDINVYGGTRVENKVSTSGYIPATKELLFSIHGYSDNEIKKRICGDYILAVQVGGCSDALHESTIGQTALYLQDFGIRLSDDIQTSTVGNTNFLDMEVTS